MKEKSINGKSTHLVKSAMEYMQCKKKGMFIFWGHVDNNSVLEGCMNTSGGFLSIFPS